MNPKLLLCLVILIISSCGQVTTFTPQANPAAATQEFLAQVYATHAAETLNGFDFSEKCKNVCWLGIQPRLTTADRAVALLKENDQISKEFFYLTDKEIQTSWFIGNNGLSSFVYLIIENGVVKSISIEQIPSVRMKYIVDLLGEPDGIAINLFQTPEYGPLINYSIYYSQNGISVISLDGNLNSPNPNDQVEAISLGVDVSPQNQNMQPWLGYGHIKEYLPGQELLPSSDASPTQVP